MTIHAKYQPKEEAPYRTQASSYYEALAERLQGQSLAMVPRSQAAWGAEQNRLGSWGTGLGTLKQPGVGAGFTNGQGRPAFAMDPEEAERGARQ